MSALEFGALVGLITLVLQFAVIGAVVFHERELYEDESVELDVDTPPREWWL